MIYFTILPSHFYIWLYITLLKIEARKVPRLRFKGAVYVLHAFQKKAKKGIATPKQEIDLVKRRLKIARQHYNETYG